MRPGRHAVEFQPKMRFTYLAIKVRMLSTIILDGLMDWLSMMRQKSVALVARLAPAITKRDAKIRKGRRQSHDYQEAGA